MLKILKDLKGRFVSIFDIDMKILSFPINIELRAQDANNGFKAIGTEMLLGIKRKCNELKR